MSKNREEHDRHIIGCAIAFARATAIENRFARLEELPESQNPTFVANRCAAEDRWIAALEALHDACDDLVREYPNADAYDVPPPAVALGQRGGRKGGRARAKALTPERRAAIASRAATARWAKWRAAQV